MATNRSAGNGLWIENDRACAPARLQEIDSQVKRDLGDIECAEHARHNDERVDHPGHGTRAIVGIDSRRVDLGQRHRIPKGTNRRQAVVQPHRWLRGVLDLGPLTSPA